MLEGENIICFAKDWSEDPTSNNHVMRILARRNKVVWVNSIGLRKPSLANGKDLGKMVRAVKRFTKGPVQVAEGLWVFTPLVLPLPHSAWATAMNQQILTRTLAFLRWRLGIDQFQLWTFLPNVGRYVGALGESFVVYYCTDEFSQFSYLDGPRLLADEQKLCRRADVVFATAHSLWERLRPLNAETHLALHGVDHQHFAAALASDTAIPAELADAPRPIIGFFGLIHDWIDLDLIGYLAERRPDWTIALIGKASVDVSRLLRYPNVRILGRKPYADLPGYCKAFSVGLLPFVVNALTRSVNPIKLREYLSAGLPVVSTDLPETRAYSESCRIARSPDEFLAACEQAIANDTLALRQNRSVAMAGETWEARVSEIGLIVREVANRQNTVTAGEGRSEEVVSTAWAG
jgi:glycosyltransferase involved in cell wall biosynthesis